MGHPSYREAMFNGVVKVLESIGREDRQYDATQKPGDILEMLELILASSISATSTDRESVRESCEQSYFNIKKIALALHAEQHQAAVETGTEKS